MIWQVERTMWIIIYRIGYTTEILTWLGRKLWVSLWPPNAWNDILRLALIRWEEKSCSDLRQIYGELYWYMMQGYNDDKASELEWQK